MTRSQVALLGLVGALWGAACSKKHEPNQTVASAAAPAAASAAAAPSASTKAAKPSLFSGGGHPIPSGPRLAILPGEGVGPIRFGASVKTVERLMGKKCELRTKDACRFPSRAVDFYLKDGVVDEIHIHRVDRLATQPPKPRIYGVFNGRFVNGANFGMFPEAVEELLGKKPQRIEKLEKPTEHGTVLIQHYENMRLEYDKMDNGDVVLGGVILTRPKH